MEEEKSFDLWGWWKKYGNHLTAPLILIALIILIFQIVEDNNLKKEISLNCGWGNEEWECFCQKDQALELKSRMNPNSEINLTLWSDNDSLDS